MRSLTWVSSSDILCCASWATACSCAWDRLAPQLWQAGADELRIGAVDGCTSVVVLVVDMCRGGKAWMRGMGEVKGCKKGMSFVVSVYYHTTCRYTYLVHIIGA